MCVVSTGYDVSDVWRSNINFDTLINFGVHRKRWQATSQFTRHIKCTVLLQCNFLWHMIFHGLMSINWSEGQCSCQISLRCNFIESATIVKVAQHFLFTDGPNHASQWSGRFLMDPHLGHLWIQFTHTDTWLPWIWQIFFVTRSNSCTTLRSEWRPRVVQ